MSRAAAGVIRLGRAWRSLSHEQRLAAGAAAALFLTLFFPCYQETAVSARRATGASVSGWGAFSLVEAVVLLTASAVLVTMFRRGEGRGLRRPGAEGGLIAVAAAATAVLVIWRMFDEPTFQVRGATAISGIEWGIFIALAAAAFLAYAGNQIRVVAPSAADDDQPTGSFEPVRAAVRDRPARRSRRRRHASADQLTIPLEERDRD
jgi:hypothetical protein